MIKSILSATFALLAIMSWAQQYPDRHSTSSTDAWLSCATSTNPNADRDNSHWVQYDLGSTYVLDQVILWNYNDPSNLDSGVKDIVIDVSDDGTNWTEAAAATVPISDGSAFYSGVELLDLGAISASHLLITILNNHGGACSGFSELKITTASILPIELSKFDVRCGDSEDEVIVAWRSESEVGSDYFTIQRSTNAVDWVDVVDVAAQGFNGQGANYVEKDRGVSGQLYYRLVNTDDDGQRQFFEVASVDCSQSGPMTMSVANPFTETLSFTYNPGPVGESRYSVEAIDGRQISQGMISPTNHVINIPTSEWNSGTYILSIYQNGNRISKKIIKM